MTAKSTGDKPGNVFNLSAVEREDEREPFKFSFGPGSPYTLADPQELDWQELGPLMTQASNGEAVPLIKALMSKGDWERFSKQKLPAWRMGKLSEAWAEHYGLNMGEAVASSGS